MNLNTKIFMVLTLSAPSAWAGVGGSSLGGGDGDREAVSCQFSLSRHRDRGAIVDEVMNSALARPFAMGAVDVAGPRARFLNENLGLVRIPGGTRLLLKSAFTGGPLRSYELKLVGERLRRNYNLTVPPFSAERQLYLSRSEIRVGEFITDQAADIWTGGQLRAQHLWIPLELDARARVHARLTWSKGEVSRVELTADIPCRRGETGYRILDRYVDGVRVCYVSLAAFDRMRD